MILVAPAAAVVPMSSLRRCSPSKMVSSRTHAAAALLSTMSTSAVAVLHPLENMPPGPATPETAAAAAGSIRQPGSLRQQQSMTQVQPTAYKKAPGTTKKLFGGETTKLGAALAGTAVGTAPGNTKKQRLKVKTTTNITGVGKTPSKKSLSSVFAGGMFAKKGVKTPSKQVGAVGKWLATTANFASAVPLQKELLGIEDKGTSGALIKLDQILGQIPEASEEESEQAVRAERELSQAILSEKTSSKAKLKLIAKYQSLKSKMQSMQQHAGKAAQKIFNLALDGAHKLKIIGKKLMDFHRKNPFVLRNVIKGLCYLALGCAQGNPVGGGVALAGLLVGTILELSDIPWCKRAGKVLQELSPAAVDPSKLLDLPDIVKIIFKEADGSAPDPSFVEKATSWLGNKAVKMFNKFLILCGKEKWVAGYRDIIKVDLRTTGTKMATGQLNDLSAFVKLARRNKVARAENRTIEAPLKEKKEHPAGEIVDMVMNSATVELVQNAVSAMWH